jgi:hypothetical protein
MVVGGLLIHITLKAEKPQSGEDRKTHAGLDIIVIIRYRMPTVLKSYISIETGNQSSSPQPIFRLLMPSLAQQIC